MGVPQMAPYGRVTLAAMDNGVSRVEALEQIREWMSAVVLTAVESAAGIGVLISDVDSKLPAIYAASMLGGITVACALGGRALTDDESSNVLFRTARLYSQMMGDELMRDCEAGDAADPIVPLETNE